MKALGGCWRSRGLPLHARAADARSPARVSVLTQVYLRASLCPGALDLLRLLFHPDAFWDPENKKSQLS